MFIFTASLGRLLSHALFTLGMRQALRGIYRFFEILFSFDFRERGRKGEREGEKQRCERETLIGCLLYTLQPGTKTTTQARALTGNQTSDFSVGRALPNQLSHTGWDGKC